MIKYDSDIQGSALRYLGYSINTTVESQLQAIRTRCSSSSRTSRRSSRPTTRRR